MGVVSGGSRTASASQAARFEDLVQPLLAGAFGLAYSMLGDRAAAETGVSYDAVLGPVHTSTGPNDIRSSVRGPFTLHVQIFDGAGRPLRWLNTELTPSGGASVSFSGVSLLTGPGPYRIVITAPSA